MTLDAAQTIRNENRSIDLVTLDFDVGTTSESRVGELISDIVARQQIKGVNGETEYCTKKGAVYVPPLVSYQDRNRMFVPDCGETIMLHQRDHPAVRADYEHGTLVYRADHERVLEPLGADKVEVHVGAMGIITNDGADDFPFFNHELAGKVTRVGRDVQGLDSGTKIIGFAPKRLAIFQRTSVDQVQPLSPKLLFTEVASLASAFTTAIHVLEDQARIEPSDNVAIIDGMGAVAFAAIRLCNIVNANVIIVSFSAATIKNPLTGHAYKSNTKLHQITLRPLIFVIL